MSIKKMGAVALSMAVLTGCSSGTTAPDTTKPEATTSIVTEITSPVEITFWHAMNGAQEAALQSLTEKFMAANSNVTVTLQNQSSYKRSEERRVGKDVRPVLKLGGSRIIKKKQHNKILW